jgi:hypothetical protein
MGTWTIDRADRLALDGEVKRLAVKLMHGRLNVVGTNGPARVEVTSLGTKPLTVTLDDDGTLTVAHEDIPRWPAVFWFLFGRRFRADVSIAVPQHVPATLNVVSGSIVASSLRAGARVDMTSGRITLLGLDGRISAKVVSGPIEALNIGGELDLETVSGEITLADSTVSRVRARTISGSLTCDLDNPPENSDIRLETTSGEITARVREDSDLQVSLHCVSGRVTTAFGELAHQGSKSVSGRLGAGTGQLSASATSGNISLLRRPVDYDDSGPADIDEVD